MDKKEVWRAMLPHEKDDLAKNLKVTKNYLSMIMADKRKPGAIVAKQMAHFEPRFRLENLRPDIWGDTVL